MGVEVSARDFRLDVRHGRRQQGRPLSGVDSSSLLYVDRMWRDTTPLIEHRDRARGHSRHTRRARGSERFTPHQTDAQTVVV